MGYLRNSVRWLGASGGRSRPPEDGSVWCLRFGDSTACSGGRDEHGGGMKTTCLLKIGLGRSLRGAYIP